MKKQLRKFLHLLRKYRKEQSTPDQTRMMDIWYDSIEYDHRQSALHTDPGIESEIWDRIDQARLGGSGQAKQRTFLRPVYLIRAAVAVTLIVAGSFLLYQYRLDQKPLIAGVASETIAHLNTITNQENTSRTVALSDGSSCRLAPGSSLFYPASFEAGRRVVYLKGEGYFEVKKDAARPFLVYSDNIVTRVVGTSFTVRKLKGTSNIEVAVYSGKVLVEKTQSSSRGRVEKPVLLTPNRKVTYLSGGDALVPGLMDEPVLLEAFKAADLADAFRFKEVPVSEILLVFEKAYGVKFAVNSEEIKNCIVTADMSQDLSLVSKLEILCAAVNANFEVQDTHVIISGEGCH